MDNDIKFSIIIPSYNSSPTILKCISSIKESAGDASDYEIIVADSSDDDTPKFISFGSFCISLKPPHVKLVRLSEKTPPGTARNAGAKAAHGETLVFIDSDCALEPDYYEQLLTLINTHDVGGGSVLNGTPDSKVGSAEYYLEFSGFMPKPDANSEVVEFCPTCNFFIKKELFEKVGGFSDARTAEDIEFGFALKELGEKITFFPELKIIHKNRTDMEKYLANQFLLGKGSALLRGRRKMSGSFLTRFRFLIPLLYSKRYKAIRQRVIAAGGESELKKFLAVKREFRAGLKRWLKGFKEGAKP